MTQRNETRYQLEQDNKIYILSTSLIGDKLKLFCQDSNSQEFEALYTITDLTQISKYFQPTHKVEQIQVYLNGIIEKQRVGISQSGSTLTIFLFLINQDQIKIPLMKKIANNNVLNYNNNYNNYQNFNNTQQNIPVTNQFIQNQQKTNLPGQYLQQQQIIYQNNANQQYLNMNKTQPLYIMNNIPNADPKNQTAEDLKTTPVISGNYPATTQQQLAGIPKNKGLVISNQLPISPDRQQFVQGDDSPANYTYQFDENQIGKLEENTNIIRAEQEKLKNDMKRVLEEASKLREQNQKYKAEHDTMTQENLALKNEIENYKQQMVNYENENKGIQEENDSLRNQFNLLNKDIDAFENQNNQIRKMYEDLEKENENYKNQIEVLMKENETLKIQVQELNDNFILINKELEKIKNESNLVKNNFEKQKNSNNNEETIKRLTDEINIYKQQAQENELLKKQIQEMKEQLQMVEERQEQERQELLKRQELQEMQQRQELLQRQQRQELQQRQQRQLEEEEQEEEKEVKGEIIHDIRELEMLTKKINKDNNKKIIINLLYKASVDGDKASAFHEKCDEAQNTIVLVETKKGKRFGGFTTCSWSGNCVDKNDPQAFIFSFDKMMTYDNIPGDEAIGCYPKFGPIFLGCQIKIFDNAFTKGGTTFEKDLNFNTTEDYELTDGERTFEVKDIEVYEVIIE